MWLPGTELRPSGRGHNEAGSMEGIIFDLSQVSSNGADVPPVVISGHRKRLGREHEGIKKTAAWLQV